MIKEIYNDIEKHIMEDDKPSLYMNHIFKEGKLDEYPLNMLKSLAYTPQDKKHHPEGDVWNHVMLVLDNGAKYRYMSEDKRVFMWSVLLHDLGKGPTTKERKGRITSYDHDRVGAKMTKEFLTYFHEDEDFIFKVSSMVRWHMQALFVINKLPFANIKKMAEEVSLKEIGLLTLCDRLGRGEMDEKKISENIESINEFLRIAAKESGLQVVELKV